MIDHGSEGTDARGGAALFENQYRRGVVISLWEEGNLVDLAAVRFRAADDQIHQELMEEHLPLLEEMDYIEWDRESGEISKGPNFEEAVEHIDRINHRESQRYLRQN